ncbi:MAG: hypothetical protein A4E57_04828 [Syntrophorhabdaceae bacterium PtaU1.Bin034]|nr:MAG: hypothetical protein A4E57_04828 [Syntrophorhabdaceae bacterium PtaU1.Bin034]
MREEYQKLYAPLLLLWKGIGHFIARNPQYTILFGPVTISDTYSELSKQLMVSYLTINHYAPDLARFIRPRNPIRRQSLKRVGLRSAAGLPADIDHLSSLVADIEADRKGIPVLLRQYVKLGGRIMGFNIDPSFRNGLDGLILVDLLKCDRRVLDRYMGKQGCTDFFRFHEERLQRRMAS